MSRVAAVLLPTAILFIAFWTQTASAQSRQQLYVASTGADGNACTRTSPCRTFSGALGKASQNGQITALDSSEYGPFTVSQSIAIVANGVTATVSGANSNAITINIPNGGGVATLKGLTVNGFQRGTNGITVNSADDVELESMDVSGFSDGMYVSSKTATRVHLFRSKIYANSTGIEVTAGSYVNGVLIDRSSIDGNGFRNISINGTNGAVLIGNSAIQGGAINIAAGQPVLQSYGDNDISSTFPFTTVPRQ